MGALRAEGLRSAAVLGPEGPDGAAASPRRTSRPRPRKHADSTGLQGKTLGRGAGPLTFSDRNQQKRRRAPRPAGPPTKPTSASAGTQELLNSTAARRSGTGRGRKGAGLPEHVPWGRPPPGGPGRETRPDLGRRPREWERRRAGRARGQRRGPGGGRPAGVSGEARPGPASRGSPADPGSPGSRARALTVVLVEAGVEQPVAVGVTRQEVHGAAAESPPPSAPHAGEAGRGSRQAGRSRRGRKRGADVWTRAGGAAERRAHPPGDGQARRERRERHARGAGRGPGRGLCSGPRTTRGTRGAAQRLPPGRNGVQGGRRSPSGAARTEPAGNRIN